MKTVLCVCSFLFVNLCNGQTCASPVYNNSGVTIRGPYRSSQVITPVGSSVQFEFLIVTQKDISLCGILLFHLLLV